MDGRSVSATARSMASIRAGLAGLALLGVSCASSPEDESGRVVVRVWSHPPGARVIASNGVETTSPGEIPVESGRPVRITFELEGHAPQTVESAPAGVGTFGRQTSRLGLPGLIASRARSDHLRMVPDPVSVDLVPIGGSLSGFPHGARQVSFASAGCSRPMRVREDCSGWSGPERRVVVRGFPLRISGSEDGRMVFALVDSKNETQLIREPRAYAREGCARVIRAGLAAGVYPEETIEVVSGSSRSLGCYFRFSGPIYEQLKALTVPD